MTLDLSRSQMLKAYDEMASIIECQVKAANNSAALIDGLTVFSCDERSPAVGVMIEPSIVVVVQGAKELIIGNQRFLCEPSNFLVASLEVPAQARAKLAASPEACVGFSLKLDFRVLAEIVAEQVRVQRSTRLAVKSAELGALSPSLLEPCQRLLRLLNEPDAIATLSPLIKREIHYRLLLGGQGESLRQLVCVDSHRFRIAAAIEWLKDNFTTTFRVEDLASRVHMATSTFYHYFRDLTAMSPLQYRQWLRLNEAKQLMLFEWLDASAASYRVGYDSPTQFSREYKKLFGLSPKKHVQRMRQCPD